MTSPLGPARPGEAGAARTTLPTGTPERTLGWDVLWWTTRYIRQPDGPHAGGAWQFTAEQVRFVLWWYALDPDGRWRHTRGVLRRSKGWGKSPVVAALALAELCGPVRFHAWAKGGERRPWRPEPYKAGEPIATPVNGAWVQLAGVSEKQTVTTMSLVRAMCAHSPIIADYGLDVGLTRIFTAAGGRLEPITASAPTAEGARPTFVVEDETHHWTDTNGGTALDRVNRRNAGKIPGGTGRVLETTNAHAPGENSVAEKSYDAWLAIQDGRSRSTSLLYDAREPAAEIDMSQEGELTAGLRAAYGDSTWVDLRRIRDEVWDPATPPEDSRRFYLNQITAAADAWLTQPEWAGCLDLDHVVPDRDLVTLGFDGSRQRAHGVTDATALVGCHLRTGHLFEIAVWEQPTGPAGAEWQVPATEVDAAVRHAFDKYRVAGFYADPAKWESYVADWEARYGHRLLIKATRAHPVEWWMTGGRSLRIVRALEQFHSAVVHRELTHDGAFALTRHVLNARRRATPSGIQIAKEHPDSPRKIDAAVAAVLAWQARLDAVALGLARPRRTRRVVAF